MAVEKLVIVKRTIWIAECPKCHSRHQVAENPPKERFCTTCSLWSPYLESSYSGPELG